SSGQGNTHPESPRAGCEGDPHALALVPVEAPREPERTPSNQAQGPALVQPANHTRLPAQGRVPAVLGVCLPGVGGKIHGPMVQKGDAIAPPADEENRRHDSYPQATYLELVPSAR